MKTPTFEIIVAVDVTGGFGKAGKIPWTCKEDMKRFAVLSKEIGVCAMGKHTYLDMLDMRLEKEGAREKIIEKGILPNRQSFVISSTLKQEDVIGATVVPDLQAVRNAFFDTDQRIAVIGGEKLYVQALATAHKVHLTVIDDCFNCDRFFPIDVLVKQFNIGAGSITLQTDVDGETETVRFVNYERIGS